MAEDGQADPIHYFFPPFSFRVSHKSHGTHFLKFLNS
jgi:hypothetical protein